MATLGKRLIKTSLIYCAIIATILMLGCVDKIDEKPLYNSTDGSLTKVFKINDQYIMFDIHIQLLGFSDKESTAVIMVDNSEHQIPYNTEKMVKDYIIKITDTDNITKSAKIIVKKIK